MDDGFGPTIFFWDDDDEPKKARKKRKRRKPRQFHTMQSSPLDSSVVFMLYIWQLRNLPSLQEIIHYYVFTIYGKRLLPKEAIDPSLLSPQECLIYQRIRCDLSLPLRRSRVFDFLAKTHITKRLINYFTVHYAANHPEVAYYLDRSCYPHKIISFEQEEKPSKTDFVEWIQFHHEYKTSKSKDGRKNLLAPYARSVTVRGEDNVIYSLCELNFFIWFDDVAGPEVFYHFEKDVRREKSLYDQRKRVNIRG